MGVATLFVMRTTISSEIASRKRAETSAAAHLKLRGEVRAKETAYCSGRNRIRSLVRNKSVTCISLPSGSGRMKEAVGGEGRSASGGGGSEERRATRIDGSRKRQRRRVIAGREWERHPMGLSRGAIHTNTIAQPNDNRCQPEFRPADFKFERISSARVHAEQLRAFISPQKSLLFTRIHRPWRSTWWSTRARRGRRICQTRS